MTTKEAEALYLAQHMSKWNDKGYAVFNPNNLPIEELPSIYGYNNGGSVGWLQATLIAEDGTYLGGHICSDEGYMYHDLGILEGARPDRHEEFKAHYPNGYRMDFITYSEAAAHEGLKRAYEIRKAQQASAPQVLLKK